MASPITFYKKNTSTIIETKTEQWKNNFIEINIYTENKNFAFGYKIKIERIIRQKIPFEKDFIFKSKLESITAAKQEIKKICSHNNKTKKILIENFPSILYNQLELF